MFVLVLQGPGDCPRHYRKQLAFCGKRELLDKLRLSMQCPDLYRVEPVADSADLKKSA